MKLKINFSDFWSGFKKEDNFFWNLLSTHYELELSDEPDLLIYSVFGKEYKKYNCLRVFFTGEYYQPDFRNCDLAFSFSYIQDKRNYRLPLFALYTDIRQLLNKPDPDKIIAQTRKFCCFVVSNSDCKERNNFFKKLSAYKKVNSGGRYMNNIGGPVVDKNLFIADYKFVISFENRSSPGYLTEKIVEPMLVNSIPIYWGDPLVSRDFNSKSFVNVLDFKSIDLAIEHIIKMDRDESFYRSCLEQPWLPGNKINENYLHATVLKKLVEVIENSKNIPLAYLNKESLFESFTDRLKRKLRGERKY